jgi:hypothetical protein
MRKPPGMKPYSKDPKSMVLSAVGRLLFYTTSTTSCSVIQSRASQTAWREP